MSTYETVATHYASALSDADIGDLNTLLSLVSSTAEQLDRDSLSHILEHSLLVIVRHKDEPHSEIVAMGLMAPVHACSGFRMHIEDVCVAPSHRGQKLGRHVVETLLDHAQKQGAISADLTSRPDREAANVLYQSLGFKLRETNVYRFIFKQKSPE